MTEKLSSITPKITQLTVQELFEWCQTAIKGGYKDRYVLITSDDEQNAFHPVWNGFSLPCKEDMAYVEGSQVNNINKLIILS